MTNSWVDFIHDKIVSREKGEKKHHLAPSFFLISELAINFPPNAVHAATVIVQQFGFAVTRVVSYSSAALALTHEMRKANKTL